MPVSSYLEVYQSQNRLPNCLIKIREAKGKNFGTLGITFLENFAQYYSVDHRQLALKPNSLTQAKVMVDDINEQAAVVVLCMIGLLGYGTILMASICCVGCAKQA